LIGKSGGGDGDMAGGYVGNVLSRSLISSSCGENEASSANFEEALPWRMILV
jgi:hypothetical protein